MSSVEDRGRRWLTKEIVALFVVALGVRGAVSLVQVLYGLHRIPFLPLSTWGDFYVNYVPWFRFVHQGLLPYRDFYAYKYPPLFLYSLYPFYVVAGSVAAAIPIVVSDAATAVLVYLIAKKFAGNRVGLAAGLVYALSPFVLYYADYLWLSSQPMTFFLILAVYLLKEERPKFSIASLAVAVMFKQEAILILPAYMLLYVKDFKGVALKGIGVFVAILLAISLPFLIIAPVSYILEVNYYPIANIINLGPPEQSLPIAAGIVNAVPTVSNPLSGCGLTTLPGLYTGTLCGSIVNLKEFASSLLIGRIDQIASFLEPLLLAVLAPALYVCRRSPSFLQILCVYSMLASLVLFQDFVEPSLAYYFVPVYALIFASITDKRTLLLGIATALLSVTIPEGPFQVILPLGYLFALIALQDTSWQSATAFK